MSADANLSGAQFMRIEQVGAMRSQYNRGHTTVEQSYHGPERFDEISQEHAKARGYESAEHYHEALKAHMANHLMANPVAYSHTLGNTFLDNGHHRYFAARDLGWSHIQAEEHGKRGRGLDLVPGWDAPEAGQ